MLKLAGSARRWSRQYARNLKNYALKSIDAVRAKLRLAVLYIERNAKTVKSIASFLHIVTSHCCGNRISETL